MRLSEKSKENIAGYLFILPNALGFVCFILLPLLFSFVLIFTDWDYLKGLQGLAFNGLANITRALQDEMIYKSLKNNLIFSIVSVPASMLIGLAFASVLNKYVYMKSLLRTLIFLPYMSSLVAISVVWRVMYHSSQGPINAFLKSVGIDNPPGWLASPDWALTGIIIMTIWTYIGYAMVLYLAGLQGISKDLYEAASIDGASGLQRFLSVTVPLLKPTSFLIAITLIIASFQVFASVQVMTGGGPMHSTAVLALYIYTQAFEFRDMSYGATVSWVLFLVIFAVTMIQWRTQKKWQNQF
ncbi:multiple sugar transport system permease protein [Paenibacillus sp. UNCCL117]|uniref:carbohydrate ABC transporter permease n=1 Tax=unclassified Paenibacillus TaxID=185978 RepID=UPI00087FD787|nr:MULTISPECIES: sugar ABC transporter permease [unclassified Paenibacillus]SDD65869.1 carbohydrate ABC transporter membrane protein 1, CUT1 family [Paenibacillus sp. cl123]SFW58042.1 multiple sugar transport system permease protein [Paenibacillus sp. UNCCL117]